MPSLVLPTPLAERVEGRDAWSLEGSTTGEVLRRLEDDAPALRGWILDERGRIREHVNVFVNGRRSGLDEAVTTTDEIYVLQAISGGDGTELLVGTRKGLFILRGPRRGRLDIAGRRFAGQTVEYCCRDPRSGFYFASVTHGQFGPHLYRTRDPLGEWDECRGPAFSESDGASVDRIWIVEPGEAPGTLWSGVAPAALFRSDDDGQTWSLVRGLWDQPSRPEWEGGMGGLCLHSICPWPGDPSRLAVAISAAGVWHTEDGGETWRSAVAGLNPRYLPEEAREDTLMHCVHKLLRCPRQPETLYMQFHGGVYRSDDGGGKWHDIAGVGTDDGLPADFGFPIVVDPADPDRAFVIPLVADLDRVTPDGVAAVYETTDRGATWERRNDGLPDEGAFLTVLRQAFDCDGEAPLGLWFGTESGAVFGSADGGAHWFAAREHLPPIVSVRVAR